MVGRLSIDEQMFICNSLLFSNILYSHSIRYSCRDKIIYRHNHLPASTIGTIKIVYTAKAIGNTIPPFDILKFIFSSYCFHWTTLSPSSVTYNMEKKESLSDFDSKTYQSFRAQNRRWVWWTLPVNFCRWQFLTQKRLIVFLKDRYITCIEWYMIAYL